MLSNHCLAAVAKQPWCCYAWKHLLQCQHWNRVGLAGSHFVRVIWVRSTLKVIRVWPGLDHVRHEIKKTQYGGATMDAIATFVYFVSHTHFFKACTEPHPWIHCCCRTSKSPSLAICQAENIICSLHEATSTFTSHVPVSASFQVATPTDPMK